MQFGINILGDEIVNVIALDKDKLNETQKIICPYEDCGDAFYKVLCNKCKQYIFFESYRHYPAICGPCDLIRLEKNICKACWDHLNLNDEVKNND